MVDALLTLTHHARNTRAVALGGRKVTDTSDSARVDVSVIIPARNAAKWIGEQLGALSRQTFDGEWEVIVVDNGSTDAQPSRSHDPGPTAWRGFESSTHPSRAGRTSPATEA